MKNRAGVRETQGNGLLRVSYCFGSTERENTKHAEQLQHYLTPYVLAQTKMILKSLGWVFGVFLYGP